SAAGLRRLSREVKRGRAVRLRPGVYAPQPEWDEARPRQRYFATVAAMATARSGSPVFCRQAALVLHDLPLVNVPRSIPTRALRPGSARRRRAVAVGASEYTAFTEDCQLWPSAWGTVRATQGHLVESLLPDGTVLTAEALVCA